MMREPLEYAQLRRLGIVSLIEGTTLVALMVIAVPMKHFAGWPMAVSILGPVHGMAFLAYCWTVLETVTGGGWSRGETARLALVAFVPFGGLTNRGLLRQKAALLARPVVADQSSVGGCSAP